MIVIEQTRFGTIEIEESRVLNFENGLIGFPEQTRFVLLEPDAGKMVAYLQSLVTPGLAFPVWDAAGYDTYPQPASAVLAKSAGLPAGDYAVLVVVAAKVEAKTLEANLLAPIIVEVESRKCAQVVLDARRFSASHCLVARTSSDPLSEAKARMERIQQRPKQPSSASV